jgi:hypothetical protein
VTLNSSHYLTVNVPYALLLPEYVSLPPQDDPKFLASCELFENVPQFEFGDSASSTGNEYVNDYEWPHK